MESPGFRWTLIFTVRKTRLVSMDRKAFLKRVVIETTRRCNLKCIHCKVSPENNEGNTRRSRWLGRDPDLQGFEGHLQSLRNNTCSPVDPIRIFLTSEKFLQILPLH